MSEKRDLLDDIIDIQKDWTAVKNPLGNLADALAAEPGSEPEWDPSRYKWRPRASTTSCMSCLTSDPSACIRCVDVCPVGAIEVTGNSIHVSDACRKCGLCVAACPVEAFSDMHHSAHQMYEQIAKAAGSYRHAYVTCTRALGRLPEENEVLLPCVGCVPTEVWFSILCDFPNVSVYLPMGVCDRCRTVTGEDAYGEAIGLAEQLSGRGVGLVADESELDHQKLRSAERREFVSNIAKAGASAASMANPLLAGAKSITQRLQEHSRQINSLQNSLEKMCGSQTTQRRKRVIPPKRQLVMGALQKHPTLAGNFAVSAPVCDTSLCSMCGDCVKVCPTRAIDLDNRGHVTVEASYCIGCGACVRACASRALAMEPTDPKALVVPDADAEEARRELEKQRAEVERLKKQGKRQLQRGLDLLDEVTAAATGEKPKRKVKKASAKKTAGKKPASAKKAPAKATSNKARPAKAASGAAPAKKTTKKKAARVVAKPKRTRSANE